MKTFIALFRGINVGGNNTLPMKELVAVLEKLGSAKHPHLHSERQRRVPGQGGRCGAARRADRRRDQEKPRFRTQGAAARCGQTGKDHQGESLSRSGSAGNTLHFNFLAEIPPKPDLAGIEKIRAASERCELKGDVFYLHAPDGIGRSKLAANMEKLLGVPMTGRNWNTVSKLREKAATK